MSYDPVVSDTAAHQRQIDKQDAEERAREEFVAAHMHHALYDTEALYDLYGQICDKPAVKKAFRDMFVGLIFYGVPEFRAFRTVIEAEAKRQADAAFDAERTQLHGDCRP